MNHPGIFDNQIVRLKGKKGSQELLESMSGAKVVSQAWLWRAFPRSVTCCNFFSLRELTEASFDPSIGACSFRTEQPTHPLGKQASGVSISKFLSDILLKTTSATVRQRSGVRHAGWRRDRESSRSLSSPASVLFFKCSGVGDYSAKKAPSSLTKIFCNKTNNVDSVFSLLTWVRICYNKNRCKSIKTWRSW